MESIQGITDGDPPAPTPKPATTPEQPTITNGTCSPSTHPNIIIAGAGPAGLLLALLLTSPSPISPSSPTPSPPLPIKITILESYPSLDHRLRATQYGVPATRVFAQVPGLLPRIRAASIESFPQICWRRTRGSQRGATDPNNSSSDSNGTGERNDEAGPGKRTGEDHEILVTVDLSVIKDHEERMVILPLNKLTEIMYGMLTERKAVGQADVEILFEHEVLGVGQAIGDQHAEGKAWVDVRVKGDGSRKEHDRGEGGAGGGEVEHMKFEERIQRFEASYIIGCDGSRSAVRKSLFGHHWPGVTFDCHLSVQNVYYPGFETHNWTGGNYLIDPEYWGLIANRGKGGLWRVTYGDNTVGLTDAEYELRREKAFEVMLPGHPKAGEYKVEQTDHFRTHNRCVDSMRVGRVLLVGDAAHVNNPWGGYGCMSAVLDAGGLAQCLRGLLEGKAGEEILDLYAEVRREKFLQYVDRRSRMNYERVRNEDPGRVVREDKLMGILRGLEGDAEGTKEFLLKTSSIEYDFTQHYR
ncbi:Para-nitrophenol 4-monooxygenase [Cyphellophora attinorum]|uniref:Para-nitrophenol 4-monooxygenase n=1 Tax=Cyphellophora attinorum TaxID=1664694 RepID=A0A0N0NJZ0_9EURO|nr:Para-nitrophenol 4-monooxygenase [Phialophora attinorum]KPI37541.1 Para-nitrophenol 4-monooxygenase [Phialophora attinorum]